MRNLVLAMATLFAINALAVPGGEDIPSRYAEIATCISYGAKFDVLRDTEYTDSGYMVVTELNTAESYRLPISISYTNAGARAIISSSTVRRLVLVGTINGPFPLHWGEVDWQCQARF